MAKYFYVMFILLSSSFTISKADQATVATCPCRYTVSRRVDIDPSSDKESFDILVTHPDSGHDPIKHLSRRGASTRSATRADQMFHAFPDFYIPDNGTYRITVHHSTSRHVDCAITLESSNKQALDGEISCSVIFSEHKPERNFKTSSRFISPIPNGPHGNMTMTSAITGGLVVNRWLLKSIVSLTINQGGDNFVFCTGTILSGSWILTAAQCPMTVDSKTIVLLGANQLSVKGYLVRPRRVIRHAGFTRGSVWTYRSDIALVELTANIAGCCNDGVRFMRINARATIPYAGSYVRVAGFGFLQRGDMNPRGVMTRMPLSSQESK